LNFRIKEKKEILIVEHFTYKREAREKSDKNGINVTDEKKNYFHEEREKKGGRL